MNKTVKLAFWTGIFCIAFGMFFLMFLLIDYATAFLRSYSLLPELVPFTELYIEDHRNLPANLSQEQVATASFTIRNREGKDISYPFIITREYSDTATVIGSGEARISSGASKNIIFSFAVASPEAKTKIEVSLPDQDQRVHFWVNNNY